MGGQEKRKDSKLRKKKSEEKVVGFSSASLFPTRKREAVPHNEAGSSHPGWNYETKGINYLMRRKTQEAGIVKYWEDKRDRERIPDTFT